MLSNNIRGQGRENMSDKAPDAIEMLLAAREEDADDETTWMALADAYEESGEQAEADAVRNNWVRRQDYVRDVQRPGKFEGTACYVPYFYGQDGENQGAYTNYRVDETDREIFPELTAGQVIWLYESYYGFVGECDEPSEEDIEGGYNDY